MDKKELMIRFQKLEEDIFKLVHLPEIKLDKSVKRQAVIADIKKHILAVERAKVLFVEYENIANQIEEIEMREKTKKSSKSEAEKVSSNKKEEYKDELVVDGNEVKSIKKKKTSSKQM